MEHIIDAQNHQKWMAEKNVEIMRNHVFLMYKKLEFHCKNNGFWRFYQLRARTEKVSKHYKKWYRNRSQINEKSMQNRCSTKWCQNHGKRCRSWSQQGTEMLTNTEKCMPKNNVERGWPDIVPRGGLGPNILIYICIYIC